MDASAWVQTFVDHDATITGAIRFHSPTVTLSGNKTAAVTLCADESKAFNKFLETRKIDHNTPSDNSYVYYISRPTKRGSEMCTP